jgi:hypothetical protein
MSREVPEKGRQRQDAELAGKIFPIGWMHFLL